MAYGKIKADAIIYDDSGSDVEKTIAVLASAASTASPTFTGTVTVPTASANDNTTKAASTAFVMTELADYATKASPTFTGTVGAATITATGVVSDSKGDVRKIPINATTSSHTLIASDAGKCITNTTGGVTVPQSVFSAGDAVTIINLSGSDITITQASGVNLYNTADGSTGNRTLATRGIATVFYQANNIAYISGSGLS